MPYDGVNKRDGGGGNQMNRPPLLLLTISYAKLRFSTLDGSERKGSLSMIILVHKISTRDPTRRS